MQEGIINKKSILADKHKMYIFYFVIKKQKNKTKQKQKFEILHPTFENNRVLYR